MMDLYVKWTMLKYNFLEGLKDEAGLGTIEIAVIIIVLIGLALLFRGRVEEALNALMDNFVTPEVLNDN